MKIILLSLDSGTDAQVAALRNEVERVLGWASDPLEELLRDEEGEFDNDFAVTYLNALHRRAHGRACSFPRCSTVHKCCNGCAHRERAAR